MAPPLSVRIRIEDMIDAIDTITDLIGGLDFAIYEELRGQRRGVERCIEIVSEASRHLPDDLRAQYPDIPWRSIRDIGNVLRHGYSAVDNQMIWQVATIHLPTLKLTLNRMLGSLPPETED